MTIDFTTKGKYFNPNLHFYVCSYGGSGSFMLSYYLGNFGNVYHIHSRNPPNKLTMVENEWFNDIEIKEENIKSYKVIYIYRNPINAIFSRFLRKEHPKHIQCENIDVKLPDVIKEEKDLYGIEEFFNNYTVKKERNYKIISVKYELFFNRIPEFNKILEIPNVEELYPKRIETKRMIYFSSSLYKIYKDLIDIMKNKEFIEII
jgi:hypothetical protein